MNDILKKKMIAEHMESIGTRLAIEIHPITLEKIMWNEEIYYPMKVKRDFAWFKIEKQILIVQFTFV